MRHRCTGCAHTCETPVLPCDRDVNLDSILATWMKTNDPPDASFVQSLSTLLTRTRANIDSLKQTAEAVEGYLAQLRSLQTIEENVESRCEKTLSPWRRLPTEVLSVIFPLVVYFAEDSVDEQYSEYRRTTMTPYGGPDLWRITHVCSQWRSAAITMPSLWSSFSIVAHSKPLGGYILAEFLRRSRSYPLSFQMNIHVHDSFSTSMFTALIARAPQWHSVQLIFHGMEDNGIRSFIDALSEVSGNTFTMLSSFFIYTANSRLSPTSLPIHVFQNSMNLRTVCDNSYGPIIALPYHRIQDYTVYRWKTQNLHILHQMTNLTKLSLYYTEVLPNYVVLPKLSTLHTFYSFQAIFSYLHAPALKNLIVHEDISYPGVSQHLRMFLGRSGAALEHLTVYWDFEELDDFSDESIGWPYVEDEGSGKRGNVLNCIPSLPYLQSFTCNVFGTESTLTASKFYIPILRGDDPRFPSLVHLKLDVDIETLPTILPLHGDPMSMSRLKRAVFWSPAHVPIQEEIGTHEDGVVLDIMPLIEPKGPKGGYTPASWFAYLTSA